MKYLLIILALISFNSFTQKEDLFRISGVFKHIEHPVKTQLILTEDDGEIVVLDEQFGVRYSYGLEHMKNYQIRFTYSPSLVKTITIIPRDVAHYELNVDFDLREKVHCVLLFEDNARYGLYLLTDEQFEDITSEEIRSEL